MKKLLYVSTNTRKLYKQLISLRGSNSFTKAHEKQIEAIERMNNYLNPNIGIQQPSVLSK
ncbi:hypothetical protein C8R26_11774 [Nitrosomonas oligotropha]|uniref:Uncharacterized protein n=1 Tax=Nitrosomonas oligotropha TaxID=42354 RepID=A0A2T5HY23_9PROT|nr:hypothetical protein [Nitrosomonas oligotropha]PTQ76481.1 hypothetical protein C8R26_11774 [Nitrosomonas oligotropha]